MLSWQLFISTHSITLISSRQKIARRLYDDPPPPDNGSSFLEGLWIPGNNPGETVPNTSVLIEPTMLSSTRDGSIHTLFTVWDLSTSLTEFPATSEEACREPLGNESLWSSSWFRWTALLLKSSKFFGLCSLWIHGRKKILFFLSWLKLVQRPPQIMLSL